MCSRGETQPPSRPRCALLSVDRSPVSGCHTWVKWLLFLGESGQGQNGFIVHQADLMNVWKKVQAEMQTNDAFVMLLFGFNF